MRQRQRLGAVLVVVTLVGCGKSKPSVDENAPAPAEAGLPVPLEKAAAMPKPAPQGPVVPLPREPSTPPTGAAPQAELITATMPTADEIIAFVGVKYAHRDVLKASQQPLDRGATPWTLSYDGVRLYQDVLTANRGDGFITRIIPAERDPDRARKAEVIGDIAALQKAGLGADAKVELVFFPTFDQRQLPGTKGTNAQDFARVIARYDLLYAVTNKAGDSTMVDAYTGDVRSRASGSVR